MLIYLDVCCLNRPFDDQTQPRIHMESESVIQILKYCYRGEWELLGSEAVDIEISRTPDEIRRTAANILAAIAHQNQSITQEVKHRASELEGKGFHGFDALHLACAEQGGAEILLTTDDQFLNISKKYSTLLETQVENPVEWLMEVSDYDNEK